MENIVKMSMDGYMESLAGDIEQIKEHPENGCCDAVEAEVLENVLGIMNSHFSDYDTLSSENKAMAEYDEELTEANGECSFGEWEFHNGFQAERLKQKIIPRYCIVQNTDEEGSSTLEDYDTLEKAMEAYNYIKENGCHKSENDDEIVQLESGTKISMDIKWWTHEYNSFVKHEGIDVPVITIQCSEKRGV